MCCAAKSARRLLKGGIGNDYLEGGLGADVMYGEAGVDGFGYRLTDRTIFQLSVATPSTVSKRASTRSN